MNQRTSTRYAVNLNALVHPNVGRSWLCQIQDFCDGGMLLVEQNGRPRRSLPGINQGENVGIHFSVPMEGKDQHFRLEGKIVRVMDTGVGINFPDGMDPDALDCLNDHSGMEPVGGETPVEEESKSAADAAGEAVPPISQFLPGIKPDDAKNIAGLLRKEAASIIPEMTKAIFAYMDKGLMELAKDAKSNAEQSEYFAAMSSLEKSKMGAAKQMTDEILGQFDEPRNLEALREERKKATDERKAKSQEKVKLTLVNTDDFEDWLAVANIISRSERMYEKFLAELLVRMGMMVESWKHAEANPLGPAVFTYAFDAAMHNVELSKEIRQSMYNGYETDVLPIFRKLYTNTTKLMEDSGVFPELDDDYISSTPVKTPDEPVPEEVAEQVEEVEEEEPEEEVEELLEGLDDDEEEPEPRSSRRRSSRRRRRATDEEDAGSEQGRRSGERSEDLPAPPRNRRTDNVGEAIRNIYSSVRDLIGAKGGAVEEYDDDDEFFETEEVQDLLSTLEDELFSSPGEQRMPVRQRLMETASLVGGRRVSPRTMQNLEVVENLVDTIEDDAMLTGNAKNWIRQLELTLDKVAATDDDFLNETNPHRSLDVVNQLARLGGAESGSAKRAVDEIIQDINHNFDEDPEVFDRALKKLNPLVDRQNKAFTGNVQRTVKASQGQQTLLNAQRAVVSEMDERYSGREVPEILYKLLMPGWRNLLVNTHLREGEDSTDWNKHVQALDQVFQYLDPESDPTASPDYMPPEELLSHIEAGLDSISYEPGQRIPLINGLKQVISGDVPVDEMPKVSLQPNTIADKLGFSNVTEQEQTRKKFREQHESDSLWQRCFDRAQHLHMGAWVEFLQDDAEPEISIVAWLNDDATRFVFVNRRGVKTHDMSVEELATLIHQGRVRILDESDIPVTERASHRMLQNMHNQLTHQATHDDLTGLLNRKEFERELELALEVAKREEKTNLCVYMDLDQFKVINNTGGHAAGDKLLVTLAKLLEDSVTAFSSKVARLGGDEFGLLVNDCDQDIGAALIKKISDAVRAIRFEWEKDVFSLTTSFGLYYMNKETDSVAKVMSSADSACIAAKEAGRDRVHVFKEDDSEMEHRKDIMVFVSQIDRALDEDRFELNCQKIQSINDEDDHTHYEILLTVLDDDDTPLPPQDFIIAAEKFNRMGAVDRWVIRNSFKFISSNILKLEDVSFSINISGNSLTEDDFMEFVLEQFNETRLPTSKVTFEITETSAVGSLDDVVDFMERLKIIGVSFSLDDFGTGLSSYSYLRNLPVDYLKIDGIFVKDITDNPSDYAVVKSINEIGHFMGKKTIAEFVENEEIVEVLREIGVDYAQGWGIGKKVPVTELLK